MFRTVPLSIIRSFFTVHTAMVYVIQVYVQLASRISTEPRAGSGRNHKQDQDGTSSVLILLASCPQTCMIYTIAVCTVKNSWWWTEELPKHVEFYSKNKFEKLVHLVGFIVRIYHDARSPERQIRIKRPTNALWLYGCNFIAQWSPSNDIVAHHSGS